MSIIHDALKKAQQGLNSKTDQTPAPSPEPAPKKSDYIYATPPPQEAPPQPISIPKKPVQNKIKSVLAFICAMLITAISMVYIVQELKNTVPFLTKKTSIQLIPQTEFAKIQKSVQKIYFKMIHKKELPEFKTKAPGDLVPLARITVNPPKPLGPPVAANIPNLAKTPKPSSATGPTSSPPIIITPNPVEPETLNVHGVMSNGSTNVALINDQVYQEGDEVDGVKIVKISLDYITVINNGQEEKIRVKN